MEVNMICYGELLRKRDVLERLRYGSSDMKIYYDNHILAIDLRISRVRI